MLPTLSLLSLVVSQAGLGEAGESCRGDSDCEPSLACVRQVCAARSLTPARLEQSLALAPPPNAQAEVGEAPKLEERASGPGPFDGTRFFVGVGGGGGPARVAGWVGFGEHPSPALFFESAGQAQVSASAKLGVLFKWFEISADLSPGAYLQVGRAANALARAAVNVGAWIRLYANEQLAVYLPLRVSLGVFGILVPSANDSPSTFDVGGQVLGVGVGGRHFHVEVGLLGGSWAQFAGRNRNVQQLTLNFAASALWFF